MLAALIVSLAALCFAALRLHAYRRQLREMARVLEELPPESNLRLTVFLRTAPVLRLCRAVNAQLTSAHALRQEAVQSERELKYTMACISHDIRTPLTGAMGYLQLLAEEPERQAEYTGIIENRLRELEELLDQLFLYTRFINAAVPLPCERTAALLPLWNVLAELYPQLDAAGVQPELSYDCEEMQVWANAEALNRIYRNLILNALRHGGGALTIAAHADTVTFSNLLGDGPRPDAEHLFDRFYQAGSARSQGGAGLGLSIVRELMEQMYGSAAARLTDDRLSITLTFAADGTSPL